MRRLVFALSLTLSAGCASGYKISYVAGAVTKQFATESYDVYSEQFNKKLDECDPANNDTVTTKSSLDECMGKYYAKPAHEKIETAVKTYHEAAKIHTQSMIAVDADPEERKDATRKILDAAIDLLSLFPDGEKLVKKFKKLTGAK
ncbi:hypothetical protein LCGC14_2651660 [marine sediment metagenome]|uniref:Lipoprotein n=1 Tax=marine sediment metagenome TaxID=412755 RepID=A0A0F9CLN2_9ZZZZ